MSFAGLRHHLITVGRHRRLVRKECFKLGLYWQGLTHDLSKYSWTELRIGAKYYRPDLSPHVGEREEYGYSTAWLHHKGRNKHHLEYWIDFAYDREHGTARVMSGMEMPVKYVVEMFADRIAANKIYNANSYDDGAPWRYYEKRRDVHLLHPNTRELLERLLLMLRDEGEAKTFDYIRREVLKNKK